MNDENIYELRENMLKRLYYLTLVTSLTPKDKGGIMNKFTREALVETGEFIKNSSETEFLMNKMQIHDYLVKIYNNYKLLYKPRIGQIKIGKDFNDLFLDNQSPFNYGIEFGWINERIECTNGKPWPEDLPYQTRIGIGIHFPSVSVEEEYLLRDAFFFLVMAKKTYEDLYKLVQKYKQNNSDIETRDEYDMLANYNQTVATYSRLGTQSFYFFTEAFVNSIGYDFYLRNENVLSQNEIEILQGKNKGRFIPLENRIQKFQSIIRLDQRSVINTTDITQLKEPFITFFNEIKNIRDAASHFTPLKGSLSMKPDDWIEKVKLSATVCLEVAKKVWIACYPSKGMPEYLMRLDYDAHIKIAEKRLEDISKHLDF
jgi:hypothetical protein